VDKNGFEKEERVERGRIKRRRERKKKKERREREVSAKGKTRLTSALPRTCHEERKVL